MFTQKDLEANTESRFSATNYEEVLKTDINYIDYDQTDDESVTMRQIAQDKFKMKNSTITSYQDIKKQSVQHSKRWNIKDTCDDDYFSSPETRNSQTVKWKQRHRPIFQIFTDVVIMLFMLLSMVVAYTCIKFVHYTNQHESTTFDKDNDVVTNDEVLFILGFCLLFVIKVVGDIVWYRYIAKGNYTNMTRQLFLIRVLFFDVLILAFAFMCAYYQMIDPSIYGLCIGSMVILEIWLYFCSVRRAKRKIQLEKFRVNMNSNPMIALRQMMTR